MKTDQCYPRQKESIDLRDVKIKHIFRKIELNEGTQYILGIS